MSISINTKNSTGKSSPTGATSGTVLAGQSQAFAVPEGYVLTIKGITASAGTLVRTDAAGTVQPPATIGAGSFTTPAYPGTQKFLISCSAGSIDVAVGDAALGAVQVSSQDKTKTYPPQPRSLWSAAGYDATLNSPAITGGGGGSFAVALDAASPFGRPALKLSSITAAVTLDFNSKFNIPQFDGHVVWRVWIEDYAKVSHFYAYVYNTNAAAGVMRAENAVYLSNNTIFGGERKVVCGPLFGTTTGAASGALTPTGGYAFGVDTLGSVKLDIIPVAGQTIGNIWVEAVEIAPRLPRPMVMLTWDDGHVGFINRIAPILAKYNLKGVFNVEQDIVGTSAKFVTVADLQALRDSGHQVCVHQVSNTKLATTYSGGSSGTQTVAQYAADHVTSRKYLEGVVGIPPEDLMFHPWVQGGSNEAAQKLLLGMGVKLARGTQRDNPQVVSCGLGDIERMYLWSVRVEAAKTLAVLKAQLDNTVKYGQMMVTMGHETYDYIGLNGYPSDSPSTNGSTTAYLTSDLDSFCSYLASKVSAGLCDVVTAKEAYIRLKDLKLIN